MANAVSKIPFSVSAGGKGIKIAAVASPGTAIHSTGISATVLDEIWAYVVNSDTVDRKLTVEFGGTIAPDDTIELTIPAESGLVLVIPGAILVGTGAAARTMNMFAATTNVLIAFGYVNRITP